MTFSYFKHNFKVFNVKEHLAVPFVKSARGGFCVGHLLYFCLHSVTCMSIPSHTSLILLTAWNLPCHLHFCFVCLYGWSNSHLALIYLTIRTVSKGSYYVTLRGWKKGDLGDLNYWGDLNWRGTLDPFTKTYIVIENFEVQNDIVPEIMRDVLGLKEPPYNQSSKSLNATKC